MAELDYATLLDLVKKGNVSEMESSLNISNGEIFSVIGPGKYDELFDEALVSNNPDMMKALLKHSDLITPVSIKAAIDNDKNNELNPQLKEYLEKHVKMEGRANLKDYKGKQTSWHNDLEYAQKNGFVDLADHIQKRLDYERAHATNPEFLKYRWMNKESWFVDGYGRMVYAVYGEQNSQEICEALKKEGITEVKDDVNADKMQNNSDHRITVDASQVEQLQAFFKKHVDEKGNIIVTEKDELMGSVRTFAVDSHTYAETDYKPRFGKAHDITYDDETQTNEEKTVAKNTDNDAVIEDDIPEGGALMPEEDIAAYKHQQQAQAEMDQHKDNYDFMNPEMSDGQQNVSGKGADDEEHSDSVPASKREKNKEEVLIPEVVASVVPRKKKNEKPAQNNNVTIDAEIISENPVEESDTQKNETSESPKIQGRQTKMVKLTPFRDLNTLLAQHQAGELRSILAEIDTTNPRNLEILHQIQAEYERRAGANYDPAQHQNLNDLIRSEKEVLFANQIDNEVDDGVVTKIEKEVPMRTIRDLNTLLAQHQLGELRSILADIDTTDPRNLEILKAIQAEYENRVNPDYEPKDLNKLIQTEADVAFANLIDNEVDDGVVQRVAVDVPAEDFSSKGKSGKEKAIEKEDDVPPVPPTSKEGESEPPVPPTPVPPGPTPVPPVPPTEKEETPKPSFEKFKIPGHWESWDADDKNNRLTLDTRRMSPEDQKLTRDILKSYDVPFGEDLGGDTKGIIYIRKDGKEYDKLAEYCERVKIQEDAQKPELASQPKPDIVDWVSPALAQNWCCHKIKTGRLDMNRDVKSFSMYPTTWYFKPKDDKEKEAVLKYLEIHAEIDPKVFHEENASENLNTSYNEGFHVFSRFKGSKNPIKKGERVIAISDPEAVEKLMTLWDHAKKAPEIANPPKGMLPEARTVDPRGKGGEKGPTPEEKGPTPPDGKETPDKKDPKKGGLWDDIKKQGKNLGSTYLDTWGNYTKALFSKSFDSPEAFGEEVLYQTLAFPMEWLAAYLDTLGKGDKKPEESKTSDSGKETPEEKLKRMKATEAVLKEMAKKDPDLFREMMEKGLIGGVKEGITPEMRAKAIKAYFEAEPDKLKRMKGAAGKVAAEHPELIRDMLPKEMKGKVAGKDMTPEMVTELMTGWRPSVEETHTLGEDRLDALLKKVDLLTAKVVDLSQKLEEVQAENNRLMQENQSLCQQIEDIKSGKIKVEALQQGKGNEQTTPENVVPPNSTQMDKPNPQTQPEAETAQKPETEKVVIRDMDTFAKQIGDSEVVARLQEYQQDNPNLDPKLQQMISDSIGFYQTPQADRQGSLNDKVKSAEDVEHAKFINDKIIDDGYDDLVGADDVHTTIEIPKDPENTNSGKTEEQGNQEETIPAPKTMADDMAEKVAKAPLQIGWNGEMSEHTEEKTEPTQEQKKEPEQQKKSDDLAQLLIQAQTELKENQTISVEVQQKLTQMIQNIGNQNIINSAKDIEEKQAANDKKRQKLTPIQKALMRDHPELFAMMKLNKEGEIIYNVDAKTVNKDGKIVSDKKVEQKVDAEFVAKVYDDKNITAENLKAILSNASAKGLKKLAQEKEQVAQTSVEKIGDKYVIGNKGFSSADEKAKQEEAKELAKEQEAKRKEALRQKGNTR